MDDEYTHLPFASATLRMPRGRTRSPPPGKIVYAAVRSRGVTSPDPRASDGTSGRSFSPASDATCRTRPLPTRCCSAAAAALFDSDSAARSETRVGSGLSAYVTFDGCHSGSRGAPTRSRFESTDTGLNPWERAAANTKGLNADPG